MTGADHLALDFISAHKTDLQFMPSVPVLSRDAVLATQAAVCAQLGPVAGFKVGRVADDLPIIAPIPARYCVPNDGVRYIPRPFGVELEVGFTLIRALPSPGLPAQPEDYFRPCAALELVDTRLSGSAADRADLKFADFQINAGLVCADSLDAWDGADFADLEISLSTSTKTIIAGRAEVPGGSALANLDLLLSHLGPHCGGLKVGQTVITGSLCGLPYFAPDTHVTGWIDGLGKVSVRLAPPPDAAT